MEAANEELKNECYVCMIRVAQKRSTYPQHCAKYISKALQCKIDHLVSVAARANPPATTADDWDITDKFIQEQHEKFDELKSRNVLNKIDKSLKEAKDILKVLNQISKESSCEMDQVIYKNVEGK